MDVINRCIERIGIIFNWIFFVPGLIIIWKNIGSVPVFITMYYRIIVCFRLISQQIETKRKLLVAVKFYYRIG